MTKRFTIEYDGDMDNIIDNNSGKVVYPFDYVRPLCDLLNELSDENEQLKEDVERCRNNFSVLDEVKCEIAEENEQLKQTNQRLTIALKEIKEKTNIYLEMTQKENDKQ